MTEEAADELKAAFHDWGYPGLEAPEVAVEVPVLNALDKMLHGNVLATL